MEMVSPKTIRLFDSKRVNPPRGFVPFVCPEGIVDLEIGCGVGWNPIRYAQANPARTLIAIEHTREKFLKFKGRLEKHSELKNLMPVHADAVAWVTHALGDQSISRCFFFYPNPEPKAASRRWIRMPFFGELLRKIKPSGEIIFVTNEKNYADEVRKFGVSVWQLSLSVDRAFDRSAPEAPRTHFEKKYLLRGETCFEIQLKKSTGQISPAR